ncbi:MAG TPA: hypothetical protein VMA31_12095 [Bryobacteraceae bacterium]|nr:hypothetical protein [Bryobacteraceae bacterium]
MHRHFVRATLLLCLPAIPLLAQLPSNSTLNGSYNVRYLGVNSVTSTGADVPVSFSGTFTFNGNGSFTVTGQISGSTLSTSSSFAYSVLSNGMVQMTNPFDPVASDGTVLYGGIGSNGVIVASSTESIYVDYLIGIPQASGASNTTLSGTYNVGSMTLAGLATAGFGNTSDAFFQVTASNGSLGNVTMQGYTVQTGSAQQTQTSAGASYSITSNGTGTMTFPAPSGVSSANALLSGAQILAVSSDGNLFIAGSASSFDFIIGLKAPTGSSTQINSGYYFTGYFQNFDPGNSSDESTGIYGSWGSSNEIPSIQTELDHERTNCDACYNAYDEVFDDGTFTFGSNGLVAYTSDPYSASEYAVGPGGTMVLGVGLQNVNFELNFYVQGPAMTAPSGTSVFLNPQGIINAASSAPFSAQYSPGEVITLYGTNLTSANNTAAAPFPNNLSGVQVFVTGAGSNTTLNAPIYNVCSSCNPTQVSAVIPYNVTSTNGLISFQVVNNGTPSNTVTGYLGSSSPGIFTIPPGGIYDGAIEHGATGAVVNTSSPAAAGETIAIYLTGLGAINQTVAAGAAAPTSPLALVNNPVYVTFYDAAGNSFQGEVVYQGLAPTLGGLYQLNVVVPSGMASGEASIDITTTIVVDAYGDLSADVDNVEATIAIQ